MLSTLNTKNNNVELANSLDPDKIAQNDLLYLCLYFFPSKLFEILN